MSKFDNLWQGYIHLAENYTRYKNTCFEFIPKLVDRIVDNLGWPKDKVEYILLKEQFEYKKYIEELDHEKYIEGQSKIDSIILPDHPGFWKFGLMLQLASNKIKQGDNVYPINFIIPIAVGKSISSVDGINSFVVEIIGKSVNDSFLVYETDKFEEISDCIFSRVTNKLNAEIHWFMEQQQGTAKIFYLDS
ncbi:MAG: hypothetical protein JOZ78_20015 [Chroococcidiopsidaceae cyanobacterium CP_BM_ER_R8_30]|nr:hypothetical protein [Chroococcidiopsidaceae cyanobacterium CP_BM_ER_R8_30]